MSDPRPDAPALMHRLDGLEPDNLLAFLALLGLLRALETARPDWRPRAGWSVDAPPLRPVLHLRNPQPRVAIAEAAAEGVAELAKDHVFDGQNDLNYAPGKAREVLETAATGPRPEADLFAALMSDAAAKDGKVEATPLCLLFGQGHQHFLDRFAAVPAAASPPPRGRGRKAVTLTGAECLAEALFLPWERPDETFAFRWDPEEDVRYALIADDPSKARTRTQHGANRLAAVGLPALTCAPRTRGDRVRLSVLGGELKNGVFSLCWPIWRDPLTLAALRALLGHPDLRNPGSLGRFSVAEVRVAERHSVGKFMNFGRARPLEIGPALRT